MFKLLSNVDSFDWGSIYLPLFMNESMAYVERSFEQACQILKSKTEEQLRKMDDQSNRSFLEEKINEYFFQLSNNKLYPKGYESDIHPMLIKISLILTHSTKDEDLKKVVMLFIVAVANRKCLDEHRMQLNFILNNQMRQHFDPEIRPIVDVLYFRMEQQIKQTLQVWERRVFGEAMDSQSVHSDHIVCLILDDLFSIAGNSLQSEKDICISRTHLAREICYACFKGRLTVEHLLSEGRSDWKKHFASQLSLSMDAEPSEFKLSISDLMKSRDFLNYLTRKGVVSQSEILQLSKEPDSFESDWCTISTTDDLQEIRYHEKFSDHVVGYIFEVLSDVLSLKPVSGNRQPYSFYPIEEGVKDRFVHQFFLENEPKKRFTYSEIKDAFFNHSFKSEYYHSFLRVGFHPRMLMIAHCDPRDVERIFNEFLLPNQEDNWTFETLTVMFKLNSEAALKLPIQQVAQFRIGQWTVLHWLTLHQPDTLYLYMLNSSCPVSVVGNYKNPGGVSVLHYLSQFNAEYVYDFYINGDLSFDDLIRIQHDGQKISVLHCLASFNSNVVLKIIHHFRETHSEEELRKIFDTVRTANGCTILHGVLKFFPDVFYEILKRGYLSKDVLFESTELCRADVGATYLHWMIEAPELCYRLFKEKYIVLEEDGFLVENNRGETFFYTLMDAEGTAFFDLIDDQYVMVNLLAKLRNKKGLSIIDQIAIENEKMMRELVLRGFLSVEKLLCSYNRQGVTPLHLLAKHHPQVIQMFLKLGFFKPEFLGCSRDENGDTVLDYLQKYKNDFYQIMIIEEDISPDLTLFINRKEPTMYDDLMVVDPDQLFQLILNGVIIPECLGCRCDDKGVSLLHLLTQKFPEKVAELIRLGRIKARLLGVIRDHKYQTPLYHLFERSPKIFFELIESEYNYIELDFLSFIDVGDGRDFIDLIHAHSYEGSVLISDKIANCSPDEAIPLFKNILFPKKKERFFTYRTLQKMFKTNLESAKNIPVECLRFFKDSCTETSFLEDLFRSNPHFLLTLIVEQEVKADVLEGLTQLDGSPFFHWVAKEFPDDLMGLIKRGCVDKEHLLKMKNEDGETPYHLLSEKSGSCLIDLIESEHISVLELSKLKNKKRKNPFWRLYLNHIDALMKFQNELNSKSETEWAISDFL